MTVTITDKQLTEDGQYVHIILSTGEDFNITADWANKFVQESYQDSEPTGEMDSQGAPVVILVTKYRDTTKSLLEYEMENITIRAQARIDDAVSTATAAQAILNKF